jgi:hypothetical protein
MSDIISQISTNGTAFTELYGNKETTDSASDAMGKKIVGEITGNPVASKQPTANFWTAGAKDALAVVDVLNQNGQSVLTSFDKLKDLSKTDLINAFKKGSFADKVGLFKNTLNTAAGALDKKQIFDKITAAMPNLRSSIAGLGFDSKMFGDVFKDIDFNGTITAIKDSIPFDIGKLDIKDLNGLKDLLKSYTGELPNISFNDLGIDKQMITNLVDTCSKSGLIDAVPKLLTMAKDKGILLDVAKGCLDNIQKNPNANVLESVANAISSKTTLSINPDIIKIFTKAIDVEIPKVPEPPTRMVLDPDYKKFLDIHGPYGASDGKLGNELYKDSVAAFTAVDPDWRKVKGDLLGGNVFDSMTISGGSLGFKDVFVANARVFGTEEDKVLILAAATTPTTVSETLSKDFPMTLVGKPNDHVNGSFVVTSSRQVEPMHPIGV